MTTMLHPESPRSSTFPPLLDAWYLAGPTASGKTSVGLELAQRLNAEVISLDSMAIYRGMDVGTAKPQRLDRQCVPHHLLDLVEPNIEFSLSEYVQAAHAAFREIRARGREVLFVGGTPLYLKALLRGVFPGPPADWEFRREIEEEVKFHGLAALHQRLQLVDPLSAARLHPHDKRRVIRALEVYRLTGHPLSHRQTQFDDGTPAEKCKVFVLSWSRAALHNRIEARVDQMFAGGLVAEVKKLVDTYGLLPAGDKRPLSAVDTRMEEGNSDDATSAEVACRSLSRTALQAVGYREVIAYLRGACDLSTTIQLVKTRTRQFARRQDTWFRSLCECRPVAQDESSIPAETATGIIQLVSHHPAAS